MQVDIHTEKNAFGYKNLIAIKIDSMALKGEDRKHSTIRSDKIALCQVRGPGMGPLVFPSGVKPLWGIPGSVAMKVGFLRGKTPPGL